MGESVDITPLAAGEQADATAVITASFLDDPLTTYILRRRRPETISLLFGSLVADAMDKGGGWAARSDGRIIGVSIWLPPGASPVPLTRHLRRLPRWLRLASIDPPGFARMVRAGEALDALHPAEPHWFLSILALNWDHRGTGIGRRLIEAGLAPAHEEGLPVHLDTSRPENLPIYEKIGFRVGAEIQALPGSPTAWGMQAEPPG